MNPSYDPWDDIQLSPDDIIDTYKNKSQSEKDPWDDLDFDEGFWKSAFRTALQIPQGAAEATKYGIITGLWQLLALGEVLDPEEIDQIRKISERQGIPFDEDAYLNAAQEALQTVPTISNIGSKIEEQTGIPFEPKEWYQKALRLGSLASKFQVGTLGQKATAGIIAPATSQVLQTAGLPEEFADIAGLGAGNISGTKVPQVDIGKAKKPSGLLERGFESIKNPREVSESKISKINEKLESDFRNISDKIIEESPIGETAKNLIEDPKFKQQSRELLNQAQEIADTIPEKIPSKSIKKELGDLSAKRPKGYALDEYDKNYLKFMKQSIKDIKSKNITAGELVEQYRKNNNSLGEYFEPGSSKALNRAKRDALLDQNRAIANVIEKSNPELSEIFKDGNQRWTKIMDAEAVDAFIDEVFKEGVNYKKLNDWFDKTGYDRIFKRALGEKGYKSFETLMKDMLSSEKAYKMIDVAKEKGLVDYAKLATGYLLKPIYGQGKLVVDISKGIYKTLMNFMLEKPKLAITWKNAVEDLKNGNFKASEKEFNKLEHELNTQK
jgi:hypothetical protein